MGEGVGKRGSTADGSAHLARACVLCRKGASFGRIRYVPEPEGRHERGEEGDDDDPQVVVDRVHRIVLDVLREVDRGQCWEVDRGSWHVDGRIRERGASQDAAELRGFPILEARLII